jgi:undecaprenyl-diphosphatase
MKKIWYILISLLIASFFIDKIILNFIIQNRINLLNDVFIWFTNPYLLIGLGIMLIIILFKKEEKIYPVVLSGFLGYLFSYILKEIIMRIRPEVISLVVESTKSFPSSHATVVFAVFPFINKEFKKLRGLYLITGGLILFSRLYVGAHYLSDLIGGAMLGLIIGNLILKKKL